MADTDDETQDNPVDGGQPAETPVADAVPADAVPADAVEDAEQQPDAQDAPEGEAADVGAAQEGPVAVAEPVEQLTPKERKLRLRERRRAPAKPARTPEERHAERVAERARKALARRRRRQQERAKALERRAASPAGAESAELAPVHAPRQGARRVRQGVVVSDKAQKTITVRIDVARRHRRYEKIVRSSSTVHAHDENNDAHEGDVVRVIESRPLSRTKRWALVDVLERAR